jgi:F-box-like
VDHFAILPEEVLENIFKFLDSKSLLNCLLVNSRWKRAIEKSPKLMKNFPLVVDLQDGSQSSQFSTSQRFYQEIKIHDCFDPIPKNLIEKMMRIGTNVKTVSYTIYHTTYSKSGFSNFNELLNCFPKTENIAINKVWFRNHDFTALKLPKVKSLKINDVRFDNKSQFTTFITKFPMVQHLQFRDNRFFPLNADEIKTVTHTLKHVETLTVISTNYCGEEVFGSFHLCNLISFDNLQMLKLHILDGRPSISWPRFITNNPKLKTIDVEIIFFEYNFDFKSLVLYAKIGTKLTMGGSFQLTEERLLDFKESSSREVCLQVDNWCLKLSEKVFDEIMGKDNKKIEFL